MKTQTQITASGIKTVLRWFAVLPCAGLVLFLFKFPVQSMPMIVQFPVSLIGFAAYVWTAAKIAPSHKYKTALFITIFASTASFLLSRLKMREVNATSLDWIIFLIGLALTVAVGILVSLTFRQPNKLPDNV